MFSIRDIPILGQSLGVFFDVDPREDSPGLRPFKRKEGVYYLYRRAFEDMLLFVDPDRDSYELNPFDCERLLQRVVGMTEMEAQKAMDLVWGFRAVSWDTRTKWLKCERVPSEDELFADLPVPQRRIAPR